jgi:Uma2 family endonuclease
MTSQPTQAYVTFEDFVAAEQSGETSGEPKHEWLDGMVYAMAGGTFEHGRLAVNLNAVLRTKLAGRRTVLSSDVMIYIRDTNLATYPDGSVVRGHADLQKVTRGGKVLGEALTNPSLVFEILSDSTESYDRGEKFAHFMRLHSLREYVLVSQDERRIEVRTLSGREWSSQVGGAGETVRIHGREVAVDDLYG